MEKEEIINKINLFLFDMDGTLYLGDRLFPFTKELLRTIKDKKKKYLFMTNNSSKSVERYIEKLESLGIESTKEDFITSSQALCLYVNEKHKDETFYVCGTASLIKELNEAGIKTTDDLNKVTGIIMGYDTELTYKKLDDVSRLLSTKEGLIYLATNPDWVCPTEYGYVPDCGSVSEMIYRATGKRPFFIGKPEPMMPLLAMKKWGYSKEETAVIGDRIYTDIKSGLNAGIISILVMSGETTQKTLEESSDTPTLVLKDAGEILDIIK